MKKDLFNLILFISLAINFTGCSKMGGKEHKGIAFEDLKWQPNPERPDDVWVAVVEGEMDKGSHTAFHKFRPGFEAPLHTHSATLTEVVITGTFVTGPEENPRTYGPGSYVISPAGMPHITKCISSTECIAFVQATSSFDLKLAQKKE